MSQLIYLIHNEGEEGVRRVGSAPANLPPPLLSLSLGQVSVCHLGGLSSGGDVGTCVVPRPPFAFLGAGGCFGEAEEEPYGEMRCAAGGVGSNLKGMSE